MKEDSLKSQSLIHAGEIFVAGVCETIPLNCMYQHRRIQTQEHMEHGVCKCAIALLYRRTAKPCHVAVAIISRNSQKIYRTWHWFTLICSVSWLIKYIYCCCCAPGSGCIVCICFVPRCAATHTHTHKLKQTIWPRVVIASTTRRNRNSFLSFATHTHTAAVF